MSNPAFIVDGFTEKEIIHKLCPGQPVRRTDLNGKNVSVEAIAKKISSLIKLLGNRYYPIIILVDKEERNISFELMANQLHKNLLQEGVIDQDVRIAVADTMIENWIIADWNSLQIASAKPRNTDGINGKAVIKKHLGSYDETTDGVYLFCNANPGVIHQNSNSFRYFIRCLDGVVCHYLNFDK